MKIIDVRQDCIPTEYEIILKNEELTEVKVSSRYGKQQVFAKQISEDSWELNFWHNTAFKKQTLKLNFCDLDSISMFFKILQYSVPTWNDQNRYVGELKELK